MSWWYLLENEIIYKSLKKCPDKFPYLYFGGSCHVDFRDCQSDFKDCLANIFCEDFKSLWGDGICRESFDKE